MKSKSFFMTVAILIIAMSSYAQKTGTFTDERDGKKYKTVKIGIQIWMAENLAYKSESGCWALSDNEGNVATYGYLYDWEAAKNLCPKGWHLPSDEEWTILTNYLGGGTFAGGKLKTTTGWKSPNTGATNIIEFSALPGTFRSKDGTFGNIGENCYWWSSTEYDKRNAWYRLINYNRTTISRYFFDKVVAYSVRCVKD